MDYKEKFIKDMEYINNKESRKEVYIIDLLKEGLEFNYLKEYPIVELMERVRIYRKSRVIKFKTESDFMNYIIKTKVKEYLELNKMVNIFV
jgi:RAB protein geranylgeranyltransferase component A